MSSAGVVYGVDGVEVDIEKEICEPFNGRNCPSLSGKPKIFLIQDCPGSECEFGRYMVLPSI